MNLRALMCPNTTLPKTDGRGRGQNCLERQSAHHRQVGVCMLRILLRIMRRDLLFKCRTTFVPHCVTTNNVAIVFCNG